MTTFVAVEIGAPQEHHVGYEMLLRHWRVGKVRIRGRFVGTFRAPRRGLPLLLKRGVRAVSLGMLVTDSLLRGGAATAVSYYGRKLVHNLDIDLTLAKALFVSVRDDPYVMIEVSDKAALELVRILPAPFRQFYVSDEELDRAHLSSRIPKNDLVKLKLPNPGATMSGDFGEMLTAVMQGALAHPLEVIDPKKWRYKQDRTKPAPKSDVVQFVLPTWPDSSEQDTLTCSEVKAKALKGSSNPIESAIEDSKKDENGRLASTLSWLREKAIFDEEQEMVLRLDRFIKADAHPQAAHEYRAVAVISADLVPYETSAITKATIGDTVLIIVSVPNMKTTYSAVFDAIAETVGAASTSLAGGRVE